MFQWSEIDSIGDRGALAEPRRFPAAFASAEPACADSLAMSQRQVWKDGSLAYKIARRRPDGSAAAPDRTGRALEVLLGADDIGGDLAELYGYVNRSLPDAELDAFVDALATRISPFDKQAIAETKRLFNLNSLPSDAEIAL